MKKQHTKKLVLILTALLLLALLTYMGLKQYNKWKEPAVSPLRAAPLDAQFIFAFSKPSATWAKISKSSAWTTLCDIPAIGSVNNDIATIDSIIGSHETAKKLWAEELFTVSFHERNDQLKALFILTIPENTKQTAIEKLMEDFTRSNETTARTIHNATIISVAINDEIRLNWTTKNSLFIISMCDELVEESLSQLQNEQSLLADAAFAAVYKTAGKETDGNIFLRTEGLKRLANQWIKDDTDMDFLSNYAEWTALDITVTDDYLRLHGFSVLPDAKTNQFLSLLSQKPTQTTVPHLIPLSVSYYLNMSFSDFQKYNELIADYRSQFSTYENTMQHLQNIDKRYNSSIVTSFTEWFNNEYALASYNNLPADSTIDANTFAIFRAKDTIACRSMLTELHAKISGPDNSDNILHFNGFPIYILGAEDVLPAIYGKLFSDMVYNHFTFIGEYIVFANCENTLRRVIIDYLMENTLSKNINYTRFSDYISSSSNILLYVNFSQSSEALKRYLKPNVFSDFQAFYPETGKLGSFALQVSSSSGMLYNNIVFKPDPVHENITEAVNTAIWEFSADTLLTGKPEIIRDPASRELAFLLEDLNGKLYYLSAKGKLLWTYEKPSLINSEIYQIDRYKNRKHQILFSTPEGVYIIDKLGRNIEGFPVRPKEAPISPVGLFDYDSKRDYRIVFADALGRLRNYAVEGKEVSGWENPIVEISVVKAPQHFRTAGKDYIVVSNDKGRVYILNRRGRIEQDVKVRFASSLRNPFYLADDGRKIVSTDSTAKVYFLQFNGSVQTLTFKDFSHKHYCIHQDISGNGKKDFVFADGCDLVVFSENGKLLYKRTFDMDITAWPIVYNFGRTDKKIGIFLAGSAEIHLVNNDGSLHKGFPVYATGSFSITDVNNDGKTDLVLIRNNKVSAVDLP